MNYQEKYEEKFNDVMPEPQGYYDYPIFHVRMEALAKKAIRKNTPLTQKEVDVFFGYSEPKKGMDVQY